MKTLGLILALGLLAGCTGSSGGDFLIMLLENSSTTGTTGTN